MDCKMKFTIVKEPIPFLIIDDTFIDRINLIYPLIIDNALLHNETENQLIKLILYFKQKFESKFMIH